MVAPARAPAPINHRETVFLSEMGSSSLKLNYNTRFDDLPDALVVEILSRLPVKTLVQSTCVRKLWCSIISTASFVSAHLSRCMVDPCNYFIFLCHYFSPSMYVISHNPLIIHNPDFRFPFETQSIQLELISACNGLICVTDSHSNYRGRDIYLTNPFIHKYKKLDVESSCYADLIRDAYVHVNIGFGYCEVENDYKVLRILIHSGDVEFTPKVEIYSLNKGKWKVLDVSIAVVAPYISPTFVNGCLYWRRFQYCHQDLLCFDLRDELFRTMELPKTCSEGDVLVKNGSLAIVFCTKKPESPCINICLLVLEKKLDGQVWWDEFNYECVNFYPRHCVGFGDMGLNRSERLLFVAHSNSTTYIVAVDLDNLCAIERFALDLTHGRIDKSTNVLKSLVLFSD